MWTGIDSYYALEMLLPIFLYWLKKKEPKNEFCLSYIEGGWFTQMLTQEEKNQRMQVCKDLLSHYEAEGGIFQNRIIIGDKTCCHY